MICTVTTVVQVPLEQNPQNEIKMSYEDIDQVIQENLENEVKVVSEEIVQESLSSGIEVLSEDIVHVGENLQDQIKVLYKETNQVQECFQSSITWVKPKRMRWKNFTQPEKLQSTIVISIKSKFSQIFEYLEVR